METIFNALTFLGNEFALFIISMIPLIELRGAVILGAALDMNWVIVLIVSVIGNMVPIPFLLLFGRKTVSYTHLDVYKRQVHIRIGTFLICIFPSPPAKAIILPRRIHSPA